MGNIIRTALVGVGNCASALIQGISYYHARPHESLGLITKHVGPYGVGDIKIVAAFDVDSEKVGKDISEAIRLGKNNVTTISEVTPLGTIVSAAPVLDGLGEKYREMVPRVVDGSRDEVLEVLRRSEAETIFPLEALKLPVAGQTWPFKPDAHLSTVSPSSLLLILLLQHAL
jgi:myo-inositol-1-phosphate synthase